LIEGALALNGVCISEQDIQFFKEAVQIVPEKTYRDEEGHVYTRLLDGCHKLYSVAPFGGHNVKFAVGNFQGSLSFYNDLLTAQRVWERVNQPDLQDLTGAVVRAERILGIRV
jgi:catechol 2,3-dioxygenase-like lactoylglutathione lyase family enzyme